MTWNLPTILLGLAVLAVFVAIVAGGIRKRRRGGHSCSCGGGCGGVSAVRDTGVREPAGRFRREAPLHILYGALTWRAAGDML